MVYLIYCSRFRETGINTIEEAEKAFPKIFRVASKPKILLNRLTRDGYFPARNLEEAVKRANKILLGPSKYGYATYIIECGKSSNYSLVYWMEPNRQGRPYIEQTPQLLDLKNITLKPKTLEDMAAEKIKDSFSYYTDEKKYSILLTLSVLKPKFSLFNPIRCEAAKPRESVHLTVSPR